MSDIDLSGRGGQEVALLTSGSLTPEDEQDGPSLGLLAVFALPAEAEVSLVVYDVLGREVRRVASGVGADGAGRGLEIDDSGLAAGTYLYRLTAVTATETLGETGRMTVVRSRQSAW